eukprot:SAG31_NODE_28380_length_411_cov_0.644231_1_plen_75_part_10
MVGAPMFATKDALMHIERAATMGTMGISISLDQSATVVDRTLRRSPLLERAQPASFAACLELIWISRSCPSATI